MRRFLSHDTLSRRLVVGFVSLLSLLWIDCVPADQRELIIGSWRVEITRDTGVTYTQLFRFRPDSTFTISTTRRKGDLLNVSYTHGVWRLEKNRIHYTIRESDNPKLSPGTRKYNEIIYVTEKEVATRGENGMVVVGRKVDDE